MYVGNTQFSNGLLTNIWESEMFYSVAICNDVLSLEGNYIHYMQSYILSPQEEVKRKEEIRFPFLGLSVALGQI